MNRVFKWLIVVLAVLNFGFMAFDGSRALLVGDYVRPETGEYAGQLGPWSRLVTSVGVDPVGTPMKVIFLTFGVLGLVFAVSYAMKVRNAGRYLLFLNVLSLWYLVPGTVSSMIQIILLLMTRLKKQE
ncbi:MAG: hypothetical protein KDC07_06685 [Chitinophagaceae bacterium]|nr:hypothetical protein [Chitinophagaceae bacterium]MCB9046761.1 hypothetical protein [Chitinophagales bacterium]